MIKSKHLTKITIIFVCLSLFACAGIVYMDGKNAEIKVVEYENKLFGEDILSIDIRVDKEDWQSMLDNATAKEYISGDLVINGVTFSTVGIRTKGNSSLSQVARMEDSNRYSLQFKFNYYVKGQTCYGLDSFCMNNVIGDTTYMKDYIAYDIMKYIGVDTPLTNYANVTVNGEDFGFYLALERYNKSFLDRVYNTSGGQLYNVKIAMGQEENFMQANTGQNEGIPNNRTNQHNQFEQQQGGQQRRQRNNQNGGMGGELPIGGIDRGFPAGGMGGISGRGGGSLLYTDDNIINYSAIFDNSVFSKNSDKDKQRVITALKNLNEGKSLEQYFDVDKILRYFAAHTVVVNLDSYSSNMAQNYYIYERNGKITILPWDYNFAFGGFQSGSTTDVVNFPIDTPVSGVSMEDRPLLNKLLEVEEYKEKYHEYLQQIVDGYFMSGVFKKTVLALDTKINNHVKNDITSFTTYEKYESSLPMFIELGTLRAESIHGQLEGTIPSTTESQRADRDSLIDASHINLSDLGNMMGGGGFGGRGGDRQDFMPAGMGNNMLDMGLMQEAMAVFQHNGNVLTDEVKEILLSIGLTEEQIEQLANMQNQIPEGGFDRSGGRDFPGNRSNFPDSQGVVTAFNSTFAIATILSLLFLAGAFVFILKAKKSY